MCFPPNAVMFFGATSFTVLGGFILGNNFKKTINPVHKQESIPLHNSHFQGVQSVQRVAARGRRNFMFGRASHWRGFILSPVLSLFCLSPFIFTQNLKDHKALNFFLDVRRDGMFVLFVSSQPHFILTLALF